VLGLGPGFRVRVSKSCRNATVVPKHALSLNTIQKLGDIEETKKIQRRATKLIIILKHKSHKERLIHLNLPTLNTDGYVEV